MRAQISTRDYEQLSAYIDGQLAPGERRKLEERINARPDLKVALEEINQTRALIRMVPRRRAPRNFTLTPSMVEDIQKQRARRPMFGLFPALSFASALATLVLVATLIFDLSPGRSPAGTESNQPVIVAMQEPAEKTVMGETEAPAPKSAAPAMEAAPGMEVESASPEILQTEQVERVVVEDSANSEKSSAPPPVITWNDPTAPQMDTGIMGKGSGGYAPMPGAYGMGGGDGSTMPAYGTVEGGLPSGGLIIPLEAVEAPAEDQVTPKEQVAPVITGGGPVLGLPPTEEAGQIEIMSAFGEPLAYPETETGLVANSAVEPAARQAEDAELPVSESGWPPFRLLQVLLALLAIITGVAAFLVRRNRA